MLLALLSVVAIAVGTANATYVEYSGTPVQEQVEVYPPEELCDAVE